MPVNRAVQGGCRALTVLLETQVDRRQSGVGIRDGIDHEPPQERIAPASLAGPVEPPPCRVVGWVAAQVGVVSALEAGEGVHDLEVSKPPLDAIDGDAEVAVLGTGGNGRIRRGVGVRRTGADIVPGVTGEVDVVAGRWRCPRRGRPEVRGDRIHGSRWPGSVVSPPMDRPVQRGGAALTMLLESQVHGAEIVAVVADAVDSEPPGDCIAAAPFSEPTQAALRRVVERIALQIGVITGLQPAERAGTLEVPGPPLVAGDADGKVAATHRLRDDGARLGVFVGLTPADVIAGVALQLHEVRDVLIGAGTGDSCLILPAARGRSDSERERYPTERFGAGVHASHARNLRPETPAHKSGRCCADAASRFVPGVVHGKTAPGRSNRRRFTPWDEIACAPSANSRGPRGCTAAWSTGRRAPASPAPRAGRRRPRAGAWRRCGAACAASPAW